MPGAATPAKVAGFRTGQILRASWARDSKSIVFVYGQTSQDVVLMSERE